jgi:glycosyltransferase involved in cell wall biosynthesis
MLQENNQVRVLSFQRQYPGWLYPGKSDKDPSQSPLRVPAEYTLDPLYPWTWWSASRRIIDFQPDLVVFAWWTTFWAMAYAAVAWLVHRRGDIPIVFLIHNVIPHEQRRWDAWLARLALRQGDRFIVQSQGEREKLLAMLPGARVALTPLPLYDRFGARQIDKQAARSHLGLPADTPVALFFGIVRPYKGLQDLLEALALLMAQGELIHLVVAGEHWEEFELYSAMIARLELATRVTFENRYIPDEEVSLYFSACDIFVAPYRAGTQSATVKMAMGFGLPIVVSDRVLDAIILANEGKGVFVCPAGQPSALAQAIESAMEWISIHDGPQYQEPARDSWQDLVDTIIKTMPANGDNFGTDRST